MRGFGKRAAEPIPRGTPIRVTITGSLHERISNTVSGKPHIVIGFHDGERQRLLQVPEGSPDVMVEES